MVGWRVWKGPQRSWDLSWGLKDIRKSEGDHSRRAQCRASCQTTWARTQQPAGDLIGN